MFLRRTPLALVALVAVGACSDDVTSPRRAAPPPSVLSAAPDAGTGKHLVMFTGTVPASFTSRVEAVGGRVESSYGEAGVATVSGLSADAAATLEAATDVAIVTPDVSFQIEPVSVQLSDEPVMEDTPASQVNPAGAFFFARQWHLRAIKANEVWALGKRGTPAVTAAILDTGIDYTHPDLAGLVDLSRSASFVNNVDGPYLAFYFPGAHPVADLHYHGTHVAATVSSKAVAAAGVSSYTTLIGVKVCHVNGSCPSSAVLDGIMHAVANGANVINMSLGGAFPRTGNEAFVSVIHQVFKHAYRKGVTIVVAAGNEATDLDNNGDIYKTYCDSPHVICVSATGPTAQAGTNGPWTDVDAPAPYSNYGTSSIHVSAPGGAASSVWAACSRFSLHIPVCRTGTFVVGIRGTSMATPHVTGLTTLIFEKYGEKYPAKMKSHLMTWSVDDLGPRGRDARYGKGRINAMKALADY